MISWRKMAMPGATKCRRLWPWRLGHLESVRSVEGWVRDYENPLVSLNKAILLGPAISWGGTSSFGGYRTLGSHDNM